MYKEYSLQNRRFCFVLFCFFFSKFDLKEYGGRVGKGSTSPLESFFDSPQISVSWKFMSIAQQNSPALQARAIANHPTIKFTIEVSEIETTFLDTTVYKGKRFEKKESSMCVHISSLLKHFSTHTPTAVTQRALKKGFAKGEALRLLRTNSPNEKKLNMNGRKLSSKNWGRRKSFHPFSRSRHFQT